MPELQILILGVDELEALRLCDMEGCDQTEAGERMGVSRGTVQRLLKSGRDTVVRTLVEGRALMIEESHETEKDQTEKETILL